jgi:putative ABC transport system substrate-binding protein
MEELNQQLNNEVSFIIYNAEGSISQAYSLAQRFHANKEINAFFTIATPATQAMSAVEKERPIIIAAVTDPIAMGLIYPETNVCGTNDMIDVKQEINMLTALVPQAKTVGLLYTLGESNSVVLVNLMRKELEAKGLIAIDFAITNESDVQAVVESACRKVDVLLAPTDNIVASTIGFIVSLTLKCNRPLIVSDNMLVKSGALAARGVDYKENGKQAAHIAMKLLKGEKKPYELPIEQATSDHIVINSETLEMLGLIVPDALKKQITFIS